MMENENFTTSELLPDVALGVSGNPLQLPEEKRKEFLNELKGFNCELYVTNKDMERFHKLAKEVYEKWRSPDGAGILHAMMMYQRDFDQEMLRELLRLGMDVNVLDDNGDNVVTRFDRSKGHCREKLLSSVLHFQMCRLKLGSDESLKKGGVTSEELNILTRRPPTIAKLAYLKRWFALQNVCRRRIVSEQEKVGKYQGKTAVQWAEHYGEKNIAEELQYLLEIQGPNDN